MELAELAVQAQVMAERALPAGLAEPLRSQRLAEVKQRIAIARERSLQLPQGAWRLPSSALACCSIFLAARLEGRSRRCSQPHRSAPKLRRLAAEADDEAAAPDAASALATVEKERESTKPNLTKFEKPVKPFDPADEPGVTAPLGFFDPLGLCPPGDKGKFRILRSAELKHGRVAMLAAVGLVVQHYIRIPIPGFDEVGAGIHALDPKRMEDGINIVPSIYGASLIPIVAPIFELGFWKQSLDREPGDFGDPLGLGMYDRDMRDRELNNGRFAMIAAAGIILAEIVSDKDAIQQLGLA